jgi:hypothetical protein
MLAIVVSMMMFSVNANAQSSSQFLPFYSYQNVCGDDVYFEGGFHFIINDVQSVNGNYHYKYHINAKGTGVGASGAKYQWNDAINYSFSANAGTTYTFTQTWSLIGQGAAPNLKMSVTYHFTINANGELTAYVDNYRFTCK